MTLKGTIRATAATLAVAAALAGGPALADKVVFWINAPMAQGPDAPIHAEIKAFEAATGHTVELQAVPHLEMQRNLIVSMSSGAGPDVMAVDIAWVPVIADAGLIADLTDHTAKLGDLFQPGPLAAGQFEERQYALPFYTNNVALYVNNTMLKEAGIAAAPKTWAEFEAAAIAMTNPAKGTYGLTLGAAGTGAFQVYSFIWQAGGEIVDAQGKVRLNEPAAISAIEFASGLYTKHKAIPDSVLTSTTWDEVNAPFLQRRAGMLISGDWALGAIQRNAPDLDFSVHPLPAGVQAATVIGGYNLAMNRNTKVPKAALALIDWLTGPRSTELMKKYSRIAGTRAAAAPEVVAALPENQKAFLRQAEAGRPRPVVAGWADIHTNVTGKMWDQVIRGKPVAEAMAEAAKAAEAILAK
jgi:ABC-type glycerol-3-phosphate transport system substrate-binding protein